MTKKTPEILLAVYLVALLPLLAVAIHYDRSTVALACLAVWLFTRLLDGQQPPRPPSPPDGPLAEFSVRIYPLRHWPPLRLSTAARPRSPPPRKHTRR